MNTAYDLKALLAKAEDLDRHLQIAVARSERDSKQERCLQKAVDQLKEVTDNISEVLYS
jgi:ribosomal protein S15P/S13E